MTSRLSLVIGLLAVAAVFAWPMQVNGYNQTAHYALTKALARGTPTIDETLREVGEVSSGDIATRNGHIYAVKAPGLAMVSVPAYLAIEGIGMRTTGDPTHGIWVLNLFGSVLPTLLLVVAVWWLADRFAPGYGALTAASVALGSLLLPFATLFFAHALPVSLVTIALALLWRARRRPELLPTSVAGVVAGFSIVADYSYAPLVVILGVYALSGGDFVRRGLTYTAGVLVGVAPLIAFNVWAFRDPFHTPYADYWREQDLPASWETPFRIDAVSHAFDYLLSTMGLLTLTPVLAAGAVGTFLLYRSGQRAEALTTASISLFYLLFHAGSGGFAGLGPPRYLTVVVPFLMLPLALVFARYPLTAGALALVSAFQMVAITATGALAAYDGLWLQRLRAHELVSSAAAIVGITGWYATLPFFAAAVVIVSVTVWTAPPVRVETTDALVAAGALSTWAILATVADNPNGVELPPAYPAALAAVAAAAVAAWAWRQPYRSERVDPVPARL